MHAITIRAISAADTHALRHGVLHPHRGIETEDYPADHTPDSLHLGAFGGGELVAVASVSRAPFPGAPQRAAWQLRGMATAPAARRHGYGAALVRACVAHVAAHGGGILWCNGRTGVIAFYESLGFQRWGEEFQVPFTGPHYVLWQEVNTA